MAVAAPVAGILLEDFDEDHPRTQGINFREKFLLQTSSAIRKLTLTNYVGCFIMVTRK